MGDQLGGVGVLSHSLSKNVTEEILCRYKHHLIILIKMQLRCRCLFCVSERLSTQKTTG